ncbi:MAG TPA: SpoIIE family protein phosphatase [Candidatus Rifleibacterium sp.]|nr:SpoIIE family protein phosphatase [Candidatus Rifleibacterium sp.]
MKRNNHNKSAAGWSIAISNLFLFMFLPCLVVWVLGSAFIKHNSDLYKSEAADSLESDAERICAFLDPANFFDEHFRRFNNALDLKTINSTGVADLYEKFAGKTLNFIPYVFKNNALITPKAILNDSGDTIKSLWYYLHDQPIRPYLEDKRDANTWFGRNETLTDARKTPEQLVEFTGRNGKGLMFYARTGSKTSLDGLFLVTWKIPDLEVLAGLIPASYTANIALEIVPPGQYGQPDEKSALDLTNRRGTTLSLRKTIGNRFVFFRRTFSDISSDSAKAVLHAIIMLLIMIIATFMRDALMRSRINGLSVRYKLVALILYAVLLPLAGLTYFGLKYIAEYRELLQQEAFIACQSSINDLENGFEKKKFATLDYYRSFQSLPDMATNTAALQNYFQRMEWAGKINLIEIRDLHTNVLVTLQNSESATKIGVIGKVFARYGIANFLAHKVSQEKILVPSAQEMLFQEFLESPLGGWARIFESPNDLHNVSFGGLELFFYWNAFPQPDFMPAVLVCHQNIHKEVGNYLRETLPGRASFQQGAIRRLACSTKDTVLTGSEEDQPTGELKSFIGRVRRNNSPQSGILEWKNELWLAVGAPGKKLLGNIVLGLFPFSQIDDQIRLIRNDLIRGVVLALIVALLVGRLFSSTIILPLAGILRGVKALGQRDTTQRIEIVQNDELGKLSESFNKTFETLEDVIFARTIQAQIIPAAAPAIEGYQADIFNLPVADLGGDYCDLQPVANNEWLMVIGDVTGRGVSSALVSAIAKSIVIQSLSDQKFSQNKLLECLNALLYSQFKRKKCMTLFSAYLECASGKVSCVNAGHPLPLFFSAGKRKALPELVHSPLGFDPDDQNFPAAEITMQPGDCLVFYTAIFVRATDHSGKPLGTDGFAALCQESLHLPPAEMRAAIIAKITSMSTQKLGEDLTLMILKKNSEPL